jgi:2-C-methyl-D-erythritol 2,4-cyclodiphosphate synthase
MRVGLGFDAHAFSKGQPLVLGGVRVPHDRGLLGHSDADVLTHAVMDALLGAAGLGDIGRHFPDTDPCYRGISSLVLLKRVKELLAAKNFVPVNLDTVIIAQQPRLAPHIPAMAGNLARVLDMPGDAVNVKATTTEGLGFTGREEGISAAAVALLACRVGPG